MGSSQDRGLMEGASTIAALPDGLQAAQSDPACASFALKSDARVRQVIECLPHGVWVLDPEGFTTFTNATMANQLGLSADSLIGRHLLDFVARDTKHLASLHLSQTRKGQQERLDLILIHSERGPFSAHVLLGPFFDERGTYSGSLLSVLPQGVKPQASKPESEAARLLEARKHDSLGVLAGGIAHDFNHLLAVIIGQIEIVTAGGSLDSRTAQALATAIAASQRAAGLTRQLLDYAGRSQLQERSIALDEQTQKLVDAVRSRLPAHLRIELHIDAESAQVLGDPERLEQSTMHLIENAIEAYGCKPGTIHVRVGKDEFPAGAPPHARPAGPIKGGSYGFVEVRDDGIGMSESTLDRVFDPFFTTKASGRGLGLAACLGVVRTHGGFLTVDSTLHQGSVFRAYLPLTQASNASTSAAGAASHTTHKRPNKVLVVDDEPMIRTYVRSMLELEGFVVEDAASGVDALEILRAHHGELGGVLLDLSMPGMDGSVVLSALRTFAPDLPVVIQTGYSAEATAQRLAQWRVTGVLQKPYRAGQLLESIRSMFN